MVELIFPVVLALVILICIANDAKGWATIFAVAAIAPLTIFYVPVKSVTQAGALVVATNVAVYLIAGLLFSLLRWALVTWQASREFAKLTTQTPPQNRNDDKIMAEWRRNMARNFHHHLVKVNDVNDGWSVSYRPGLAEHLAAWVVYWPFYLVLVLVQDFISGVCSAMVSGLDKLFKAIANSMFSKIG